MKLAAIILSALALVTMGIRRGLSRRRGHHLQRFDAGSVSESWLAEQRGVRNDRS